MGVRQAYPVGELGRILSVLDAFFLGYASGEVFVTYWCGTC